MKKSITIIAALLLATTSLFADVPTKEVATVSSENAILVQSMRKDLLIGIRIDNAKKGKSYLKITDKNKEIVFDDFLTGKSTIEKAYNISELPSGDYTITVRSNDSVLEKVIHVYDSEGAKTYFFFE